MKRKSHSTDLGTIVYWCSRIKPDRTTLVFLPGLTADHRLFLKQAEAFEGEYNMFVWDAPGHGRSRPFDLRFSLMDKACWLHDILEKEGIRKPVLIGQSMGGYVSQCFLERFPREAAGFLSIDSAPLKRCYITEAELWLLKRTGPIYRSYPWRRLRYDGARGCCETEYGRRMMYAFTGSYSKEEYCALADHGFRILGEAIEADLSYRPRCPVLLLCGEKDKAGSARRYNRKWAERENLELIWIPGAGHNSNVDQPEKVNAYIRSFVQKCEIV